YFQDGATNFLHGYPKFAVSVAVLFRGKPAVVVKLVWYYKNALARPNKNKSRA
ncbi:hypothetical protein MKX03_024434, partial [Papaver bracteatum]